MDCAFDTPSACLSGRDLLVCHVPPKHCSYACGHCPSGLARPPEIVRHAFHAPEVVCREVSRRYAHLQAEGVKLERLLIAPKGEATLDSRLGDLIAGLRRIGPPVAVVTNASLLWREDVRSDLARADSVRLKLDTVDAGVWRRLNRPHPGLDFAAILAGIRSFAAAYAGELACLTRCLPGVNDTPEAQAALSGFLREIGVRQPVCIAG